jgi:hypothetical protein
MKNDGWNICAVFCLDSHFITDSAKFISGCFQALAAMVTLEVAHFNILTKVDLLDDKVCSNRGWAIKRRQHLSLSSQGKILLQGSSDATEGGRD